MKDLYQTLGLTKQASIQEIKTAYRKLALYEHPDRGGNVERMAVINEAYETLSDPDKRQGFDRRFDVSQESEETQAPDTISGFRSATYKPDCMGNHKLARDEEYLSHILVTEAIKQAFKEAKITGVKLYRPEEFYQKAWG